MIFVNSMSDLFHKEIPGAHVDAIFDTMEKADWVQRPLASPGRNRQRATMQTPQGLDAKHSDELFPSSASTPE
jgi:protein gp37